MLNTFFKSLYPPTTQTVRPNARRTLLKRWKLFNRAKLTHSRSCVSEWVCIEETDRPAKPTTDSCTLYTLHRKSSEIVFYSTIRNIEYIEEETKAFLNRWVQWLRLESIISSIGMSIIMYSRIQLINRTFHWMNEWISKFTLNPSLRVASKAGPNNINIKGAR